MKQATFAEINKVNAINTLHEYLNKVVPLIISEIETNGVKLKNNGTLYAESAARIDSLLNVRQGKDIRAYVTSRHRYDGKPDLTLYADNCYQVGEFSVNYVKTEFWLSYPENFKPWPIMSIDEYMSMKKEYEDCGQLLYDIKARQSRLADSLYI